MLVEDKQGGGPWLLYNTNWKQLLYFFTLNASIFWCSAKIVGTSASSFSKYVFSRALISLHLHNFNSGKCLQAKPIVPYIGNPEQEGDKTCDSNACGDAVGNKCLSSVLKGRILCPSHKTIPPAKWYISDTHIGPAQSRLNSRCFDSYFNCPSC